MYRTIDEVKAQLATGKTVVSIVNDYLLEIEKKKDRRDISDFLNDW